MRADCAAYCYTSLSAPLPPYLTPVRRPLSAFTVLLLFSSQLIRELACLSELGLYSLQLHF